MNVTFTNMFSFLALHAMPIVITLAVLLSEALKKHSLATTKNTQKLSSLHFQGIFITDKQSAYMNVSRVNTRVM